MPRIVFEDRDHYLFAMTAAPRPHVVWKAELLAGRGDERVAAACGRLLAALHGGSWGDERLAKQFADRTLFDELRVDPYYRTLAAARPEACEAVGRLVESLACPGRSLVHGDFSPKNLLVAGESLTLVDFETGHWGDPAFDLGFFLSHLVLKAAYRLPRHEPLLELTETFRRAYDAAMIDRIGRAELAELWRAACKTSPAAPGRGWTARARSIIYPTRSAASEFASRVPRSVCPAAGRLVASRGAGVVGVCLLNRKGC